jgi:hypothetical protein
MHRSDFHYLSTSEPLNLEIEFEINNPTKLLLCSGYNIPFPRPTSAAPTLSQKERLVSFPWYLFARTPPITQQISFHKRHLHPIQAQIHPNIRSETNLPLTFCILNISSRFPFSWFAFFLSRFRFKTPIFDWKEYEHHHPQPQPPPSSPTPPSPPLSDL